MIQIVTDACYTDGNRLVMVLESDSLSELIDNRVAKMAVDEAKHFGWGGALLNGQDAPIAVDENGKCPETAEELAKVAMQKTPMRYWKKVYLVHKFGG